jgi:type II secretory pathway pseudopilin PulG
VCGDGEDDGDGDDNVEDGVGRGEDDGGSRGYGLHFRSFAWLLVGGGLRRLHAGELFAPFPSFDSVAARVDALDRHEAALAVAKDVQSANAARAVQSANAARAVQSANAARAAAHAAARTSALPLPPPLPPPPLSVSQRAFSAETKECESPGMSPGATSGSTSGSTNGSTNASGGGSTSGSTSGSTNASGGGGREPSSAPSRPPVLVKGSSSLQASELPVAPRAVPQDSALAGGGVDGRTWRFLAASFSQIDLDIWRTKVSDGRAAI